MRVIFEDKDIIVVEKPAGVDSQSSTGFGKDMVSEIKKLIARRDHIKDPYVGVVHRLDRPVNGVMVYGKTKEAAAKLSAEISKEGHMKKIYMAVCEVDEEIYDRFKGEEIHLIDFLYHDQKANTSRIVCRNEKDSKMAELKASLMDYIDIVKTAADIIEKKAVATEEDSINENIDDELSAGISGKDKSSVALLTDGLEMVLKSKPDEVVRIWKLFEKQLSVLMKTKYNKEEYAGKKLVLVRVELLTGRHHQIRVQLSGAGMPIGGDTRYNPLYDNYRGLPALMLTAYELEFTHPITHKRMKYSL